VIVNGSSNRCVWWWTQHLESEKNEKVRIAQTHGLRGENIRDMLEEMRTLAAGTDCQNFFYQMNLNPAPHEHLTEKEWDQAREIAEKKHGLEGQPYFMVVHTKHGREHPHYIYFRVNLETGKTISDSHDARKNHAIAREIERELGLQKVIGPYDRDRDGTRPERAPKRWEMYRADQSGITIESIEAELAQLRPQCDKGKAFHAALDRHDYILARGDRVTAGQPTLMIIDGAGNDHSLARRLGMKTKDLNQFMRDVDRAALPDIAQAKTIQQERVIARLEAERATVRDDIQWEKALDRAAIEKEERERRFVEPETKEETRAGQERKQEDAPRPERTPPAPELGKTQAEIRLSRSLSPGPQSFANALENRGFILAAITPADIEKEMEKLLKEWEERRRNPQTWMEHQGGFAALTPAFRESARRSFDEWEKQQEQKRQKQQEQDGKETNSTPALSAEDIQKRMESYVDYVQRKWAEGPKSQLERATGGLAVVTPFGSVYTLTPRNTGLDRDELAQYLKGIDRKPLLSVTDAQAIMQDVREQHRQDWKFERSEEWLAKQPLGRAAAEIRLAYSLTRTGQEFAGALEDRGLTLACMTEAEAERLNRWERQRLKEQWNAPGPPREGEAPKARDPHTFDKYAERLNKWDRQRLKEQRNAPTPPKEGEVPKKERDLDAFNKYRAGELVVVNPYGAVFQITAATTGAHAREREERLGEIDRASLLSVTAAQAAMRDYQEHRREERREIWEQERAARQAGRERQPIPADPQNLKGPALHIWNACARSDSARAFAAALDEQHIALATPTKEEAQRSHMDASFAREVERFSPEYRDGEIIAITLQGRVYKLTPRNTGMDRDQLEAFLAPLDRSQLHGIGATQESQQKRLNEIHWPTVPREKEGAVFIGGLTLNDAPATSPHLKFEDAARRTAEPEAAPAMPSDLRGTAAQIWTAYNLRTIERKWEHQNVDGTKETKHDRLTLKGGRDPLKFGQALEERGFILARATKEEAEQSREFAPYWKGWGEHRPVYQDGEFVVINRRGDVYSLNKHTTGHAAATVQQFLAKADWKALPGIEAARETMKARTDQRLADYRDRAAHWDAIRLKNATRKHGRGQGRTGQAATPDLARASGRAIGSVIGALGKMADGFSLDGLNPKEKYEAAKRDSTNDRETDKNADYAAYMAGLSERRRQEQQHQAERKQQRDRESERER
jgi:hypothetical protein